MRTPWRFFRGFHHVLVSHAALLQADPFRAHPGQSITVRSVHDEKIFPNTFGFLAIFLAAVCVGCGVFVKSSTLIAAGGVLAFAGAGYLVTVRAARKRDVS